MEQIHGSDPWTSWISTMDLIHRSMVLMAFSRSLGGAVSKVEMPLGAPEASSPPLGGAVSKVKMHLMEPV